MLLAGGKIRHAYNNNNNNLSCLPPSLNESLKQVIITLMQHAITTLLFLIKLIFYSDAILPTFHIIIIKSQFAQYITCNTDHRLDSPH